MKYTYNDYVNAAGLLKEKIGDFRPEVFLVLGSGLSFLKDEVKNPLTVTYEKLPEIQFVFGELSGKKVVVMPKRLHVYQGYSMEDVGFFMRMFKLLGVSKVILTNAAGCVNTSWNVGNIMLISDHIRIMGMGPLIGPNVDEFGPRFNDMSDVYTASLRTMVKEEASKLGITLREGVYMYFPGPQFETPAEVRFARTAGADAVGMSTVPEATVAAHTGLKVIGLSVMTNMAAGILNAPLDDDEVRRVADSISGDFSRLVLSSLARM